MIHIYIATGLKGLKRQSGAVGFVLEKITDTEPITYTQFGSVTDATIDQSYLLALKYALKHVNTDEEIEIFADSKYLKAAFGQRWTANWVQNDWKTAKGSEVAYKETWQEVLNLLKDRVPEVHVDAQHSYRNWLQQECVRRTKKYV